MKIGVVGIGALGCLLGAYLGVSFYDYVGGGVYCQAIARELGGDRPFCAVTPCGLDGEDTPDAIEEMAERHLRALREVQPHGPYFLGGNCNGGLIALDPRGELAIDHDTPEMAAGYVRPGARPVVRARWR